MRDWLRTHPLTILAVLLVIVIGFVIWRNISYRADCDERGGRVEQGYRSTLCLSPDGRVLDVR